MRTTEKSSLTVRTVLLAILCLAANMACPQSVPGIPEPGLTLYGQVRNTATGGGFLTYGTLRWFIQPPSGPSITVATTLTNINDQFSYVLRVPFETVLAGFTLSANTLALSNTPVTYMRSATVSPTSGGAQQPATILAPAIGSFAFSAADRGRIERVDLQVSIALVDADGDGMDDNWEQAYFSNLSQNANADFDQDGLTNFEESKAGTNPNDANSRFKIFRVFSDPRGGTSVEWSSTPGTYYALQRSSSLLSGFQDIAVGLPATPSLNSYWDSAATGAGPYFYRARVDRVFIAGTDSNANGIPDDWERLYFKALGVNPNADSDTDTMSNLAEFKAGTSPRDANSSLKFVNVTKSPQGVVVEWSSIFNKTYSILRTTNAQAGYSVIQSGIAATPLVNSYTNTSAGAGAFFYRVRLEE